MNKPMLISSLVTAILTIGALIILLIDMNNELKEYENRNKF